MIENYLTRLWRPWIQFSATCAIVTLPSAVAFAAAPAAPSSLSGTSASQSQILLSWKDNSTNELGFIVQRSLSSGSGFSKIATLGSNKVSFTDSGLTAGTNYYYRVAAYNNRRARMLVSAFSNTVSVKTPAQNATPSIQINGSPFSPGQDITITVSGTGLKTDEWVALYTANSADSDWSYKANWMYLNGTQSVPSSPINSATLHFKAPNEAGSYNFRLFAQTGYEIRTALSADFLVVVAAPSPAPAPQPAPAPSPSPLPAGATYYQNTEGGKNRVFNFDGDRPFVNPITGEADLATMAFNGMGLDRWHITNAGSGTEHITKMIDPQINAEVIRVKLFPTDSGADSHRTQMNSNHFQPYKKYEYDLEFKLDKDWNFDMDPGAGLIWQVKGNPKANQWGNPVMAFNLYGNQLQFSILYPTSAMSATTWPTSVSWASGEYVKINPPSQTVTAGEYHRIKIIFFADDRPAKFGGKGYADLYFDDKLWYNYLGPTLHPDQNGPHRADFGWYQWSGAPSSTRTLYFHKAHLLVYP